MVLTKKKEIDETYPHMDVSPTFFLPRIIQFLQVPLTDKSFLKHQREGGVREPCLHGKSYIFASTWNKTYALKFGSKILADEINSRHDKHSNATTSKKTAQSTHHPSSPVEQGRQTQQSSQQWTEKKLPRATTLRPPKESHQNYEHQKHELTDPESAVMFTIVEQLKNDMERLAKQNHEEIINLTKQSAKQKIAKRS